MKLAIFDKHDDYGTDDMYNFEFEDVHENRPEFERYIKNLEEKKKDDMDTTASFGYDSRCGSERMSIRTESNSVCTDDVLDSEIQYSFAMEQAQRREYEMYFRLCQNQHQQLCNNDCAHLAPKATTAIDCHNVENLSNCKDQTNCVYYSSKDSLTSMLFSVFDNTAIESTGTTTAINTSVGQPQKCCDNLERPLIPNFSAHQSLHPIVDVAGATFVPQTSKHTFETDHKPIGYQHLNDFHLVQSIRYHDISNLMEDTDNIFSTWDYVGDYGNENEGVFELDL